MTIANLSLLASVPYFAVVFSLIRRKLSSYFSDSYQRVCRTPKLITRLIQLLSELKASFVKKLWIYGEYPGRERYTFSHSTSDTKMVNEMLFHFTLFKLVSKIISTTISRVSSLFRECEGNNSKLFGNNKNNWKNIIDSHNTHTKIHEPV